MKDEFLNEALALRALGYPVIPIIGKDKKPPISWKEFQDKLPTEEQIREWFANHNVTGLALVTGKQSGVFVVDIDKEALDTIEGFDFAKKLPSTVYAKSGGEGVHAYFKYPGFKVKTQSNFLLPHVDIRGDGGYIILPPSKHPSGGAYKWEKELGKVPLAEAPVHILSALKSSTKKGFNFDADVPEGKRNDEAVKAIGTLLSRCHAVEDFETTAWPAVLKWNTDHCKPPEDEGVLRTKFDFYAKKEAENFSLKGDGDERSSKAQRVIELILSQANFTLFHDQYKEGFARFRINDHFEVYPLSSSLFRQWMSKIFWDSEQKALGGEDINAACNVLSAMALFEKAKINLFVRVAYDKQEGCIYYDLTDEKRRAVKISAGKWEIVEAPNLFRRYTVQDAQVEPIRGGDARKLIEHVKLPTEELKKLYLVYAISCFFPDIQHPIGSIYGPHGSAKTTSGKFLKALVDPSGLDELTIPDEEAELTQQMSHHWLSHYGNLSRLPEDISNCLCRAVTGGSFQTRKKYSDDDDFLRYMRPCIVLNGINIAGTKPDLADRSILFGHERLRPGDWKAPAEVEKLFKADLPAILGGIFDVMAKALAILPSVSTPSMSRMADFERAGIAITRALGWPQEDFIEAFRDNREEHNDAVVQGDPVAVAIVRFAKTLDTAWEGSPTELFEAIDTMYEGKPPKGLPRAANTFSGRVRELIQSFDTEGVEVQWSKDTAGKRGKRFRIEMKVGQRSLFNEVSPSKEMSDPEPTQPTQEAQVPSVRENPSVNEADVAEDAMQSPAIKDAKESSVSTETAMEVEPTQEIAEQDEEKETSDGSDGVSDTKPLPAFQKIMQSKT